MGINVLSLFDGMSCGRIALERAGIEVNQYYASELDKYAITVTQANYPNTIQMGDVTIWPHWDIDWSSIDLIIGGSPCQGFSFAGKQLAFDDPRSKLFFEYVNILEYVKMLNPQVKFMLENVKMKKEFLNVISESLGVEPVFINSALVSAQNRQRYYWANWDFDQPEDKGIQLIDILEDEPFDKTIMSDRFTNRNKTAGCLRDDLTGKAKNLSAMEYVKNGRQGDYIRCGQMVVEFNDRVKGVTENDRGYRFNKGDVAKSGISELGRILKPTASYTDALTTSHMPKVALNDDINKLNYRKLTPIECERLQTVPDNYTNHVSNTQRYKMLGNGWTVAVITHIFRSSGL